MYPNQRMNFIMHWNLIMNSTRMCEIVIITNLRNGALEEDATSYTKRNRSKVAGTEGHREDKQETHSWAAHGGCGSSRSRHEFQCLMPPWYGDRFSGVGPY